MPATCAQELGEKARGIIATFATSVETLDEDARVILALASVCAPNEPIPVGLLADAFAAVNRETRRRSAFRRWLRSWVRTQSPSTDVNVFSPSLRQVERASLLMRRLAGGSDEDSLIIHPLVAEAALRLLSVERNYAGAWVSGALLPRIEVVAADIHEHPSLGPDIRQASHLANTLEVESAVWLSIWVGRFEDARGVWVAARAALERAVDLAGRILGERASGHDDCSN